MNYFTSILLKQVICFLLCLTIQNMAAQTILETKYGNGSVKIRYHLRDKDTFCIEQRLENGWLYAQIWKDSSYHYAYFCVFLHKIHGS